MRYVSSYKKAVGMSDRVYMYTVAEDLSTVGSQQSSTWNMHEKQHSQLIKRRERKEEK